MRKLYLLLMGVVCLAMQASAQRTVTGKVTDEKGIGLPNVSVLARGTTTGTTTKQDGTYSLVVPANAKALVFSAVDMSPVEVAIGTNTSVNATLKAEDKTLQEVVVVGYGTQRKKEVTGNLSSVKGTEIAQKPVQSFESALAGKAAGVNVSMANGILNAPPVFSIRGVNSISLSSYPLVVIDGVPTYTGDQGATNAPANPLASINPADIESIDIAKDAAAASIYGSRAANGVVFVTTKKGRAGKARVSYDGWVGFARASRLPDILTTSEYVTYKNTALANLKAIVPATTGSFIIPNDANGNPIATNWYDEVYRQAISHSHTVSVSGGNEGTTYYLSAGYTNQEGILQMNNFNRVNTLLNIDSRVNNVISIGGKVSYSTEKNEIGGSSGSLPGEAFASAGAGRLAFALPPNVSPFNNNGTYNIASGTAIGAQGSLVNGANPYTFNNVRLLLDLNRSNNEANHLQANAYLQVKPLKWITLKTVYGIDHLLIDNDIFYNPYHGDGAGTSLGPGGGGIVTFSKDKTSQWTNTAQFDFGFGKHTFSALVGNEQQRRFSTGFGLGRRTLSDSGYTAVQAGFVTNNTAGLQLSGNYLISTFGRLNYNFKKKYYLSGNVRQDEYSALGEKRGVFWGASIGWEVAQEAFWTNMNLDRIFSSFKLRASHGKVGNIAGIGNFATFSNYTSGFYGGAATLAFSSVGNDKIKWETSTKTDFGLAFGLFKDRLTVDMAYYKNDIDGLILSVPQAPSTGLPNNLLQNVGTMYNKGFEFTFEGSPIRNKNFTWNSQFNIATNKNMVTSLAPGITEILTATSLETVNKTLPGYSAGYLWLIRTNGVDPATGKRIFVNSAGNNVYFQFTVPAGQFQYSNANGTKYDNPKSATNEVINQTDDAVLYGNTIPKVSGGFTNNFRYKNFDINTTITFQMGFWLYYGSNAGLHDQRFWNNTRDVLKYWTKPGDVTDIPKPIYGDNTSNGSAYPLDINAFKGDYLKFRSIQVGYTLPKTITDKAKLTSIRFYVAGQNLAVITDYPGPDPEVSSNGNSNTGRGVDRNTTANGRTITIGLNVGF